MDETCDEACDGVRSGVCDEARAGCRDTDFSALRLPLPQDVDRLKGAGSLAEAARACRALLQAGTDPAPAARLRLEAMRLERLAAQYPVTRQGAVEELRRSCPNVAAADLERLERKGLIDWRMVNGEARYLASWLRTLRLYAGELPGLEPAPSDAGLLDAAIAEMRERSAAARGFTLRAGLSVLGAPARARVRAWLPVAAACPQHAVAEVLDATPGATFARPDAPQRTVCWGSSERRDFFVTYRVRTSAPYVDLWSEEGIRRAAGTNLAPSGTPVPAPAPCDLAEREPHVVFTPLVRDVAARIARGALGAGREAAVARGGRLTPHEQLELARGVYDFLTHEVLYRFQPNYAQLDCIADTVLATRRADCGMFSVTFISLCRALGIPARWQSGLFVTPDGAGPHDWAMWHVDGMGWLWADCSFGADAVREGSEERRRHYFGNLDPFRVACNREFFSAFEPAGDGARWDPFDNQLGEASVEGRPLDAPEMRRSIELLEFGGRAQQGKA